MIVVISRRVLIAAHAFPDSPDAAGVAAAIARGLEADGQFEADLCPVVADEGDVRALPDSLDFDARMRRARAVVVAAGHLDHAALRGSVAFEIATRARQAGVPSYAVTARDTLDRFEARILDLQLVVEARSSRALVTAGRRLAAHV
jgi:glycerate kinase